MKARCRDMTRGMRPQITSSSVIMDDGAASDGQIGSRVVVGR